MTYREYVEYHLSHDLHNRAAWQAQLDRMNAQEQGHEPETNRSGALFSEDGGIGRTEQLPGD